MILLHKVIINVLVFSLAVIIAQYHCLSAPEIREGVVIAKSTGLFDKTGKKAKKLATLKKGTPVLITDETSDWYKVTSQGKSGWVKSSDVEITSKSDEPKTEPEKRSEPQYKPEAKSKKSNTEPGKSGSDYKSQSNKTVRSLIAGIKGGVVYADFAGADNNAVHKPRICYSAGASIIYSPWTLPETQNTSYGIAAEADLLYIQKGSVNGDTTYKADYISLPIMLRFSMATKSEYGYYINGGAYFAFNNNAALATKDKTYLIDDLRKYDYGWLAGLGLYYKMGKAILTIDAIYSQGLISIHDKSVHNLPKDLDIKNSVLAINAGIYFAF